MIYTHPCGCVEYEHGNHYCPRHSAMTPSQRAYENIREHTATRKHQDGGHAWICPSCQSDVIFENHKPNCSWLRLNAENTDTHSG